MKTKLQLYAIALGVCIIGITNSAKAGTVLYYKTTNTSPSLNTSWCTSPTGTSAGVTAFVFNQAGNTFNYYNSTGSPTGTLTGNWTVGSGSTINIGSSTATFNTGGKTITSAGTAPIINVLGNGTLNITTSTFWAGATFGTCSPGSTVIYNLSGATVGSGTYDNLTISANATFGAGNVVTVNNVFNNSAIVTISVGSLLTMAGTMSGAGTISGDGSGAFWYTGSTSVTLNMDQTTVGITNVMSSVETQGSGTLNLGNALCIVPGGDITPYSGTINVGANLLTLSASQGLSGSIGDCSGGTLSGSSIISQVYHNPTGNITAWTTLGSAGVTNANFQQWGNSFQITCASCLDGDGSSVNGGVPFTSITSYDETQTGGGDFSNAAHYINLPSDANTINNGVGYWVFMGYSYAGSPSSAELITVTGAPAQGPISLPFTFTNASNAYNLLANPYPCPISWSTLIGNNPGVPIDGSCYIYNAQDGSYGVINSVGTAVGSYPPADDVVASGMAFYVLATGGGSIALDETVKAVGGQQDLERLSSPNHRQSHSYAGNLIPRFVLQTKGTNMQGQTMFAFDSRANLGLDQTIDAVFMPGIEPLKVTSIVSGKDMAINGLPNLTQNYSIPVRMSISSGLTGSYQISVPSFSYMPEGGCISLHDNYTNIDHDLRAGAFSVTLNDTETVARFTLNITVTPLAITTNANQATCHAKNDGLITAVGNDAGPWNYTWKDATGAVVKTTTNKATADSLPGLNNGVYTVEVSTVGSCNSATQTFTITAPASSMAAFTASTQVNVGDNVSFVNSSTNASNYIWDFGDGDISSLQTPVYAYNNPGTYTITLSAINASCNDTVKSTQVIQVNATTGIKQANVGSGDINISRDATGNYIQFDYANQTKVNINVYNVLGQTLLTNADLNVVNDKIYLNVADNKNQVLYVTITNLNNNQQTTKKFVNN